MLQTAAKDTCFSPRQTLRCRDGRVLDLRRAQVMGILNLTPDSFYAGNRIASTDDLLRRAEAMLQAGAAILDLGGYSTRPGAEDISAEEEKARVLPALEAVRGAFPEAFLSVDTFRASVAAEAIAIGTDIINDVSGGTLDADMFATAGRLGVPYVLMHMRGTPQNMAQQTHYEGDLVTELVRYFRDKLAALYASGVTDVILDPGFGFAKTPVQSHELLRRLPELALLGLPVLAGLSRKSLVYKPLGLTPETALTGTIAVNTIALLNGARLLRVHDVAEAVHTVRLVQQTFIPSSS
ncbi:dihydropteroate synthase [Hymenobacter qilianensis]|uniref:Dihydropteroate synthase n=2 Tax=Hymenobacter qilianensis TaxID=1385715 RepID=A0ACB5PN23_9BACT|nr:dihydropteroate synthase [Hymenobacter qilianensis]QNP53591.1 dihydropteroate synthase [Hymenobacter qilianensis]GGF54875.1 dihydropteroate synthase [Hymenobacter qilianensis]